MYEKIKVKKLENEMGSKERKAKKLAPGTKKAINSVHRTKKMLRYFKGNHGEPSKPLRNRPPALPPLI
jgi:hypothetical protein